MSCLFFPFIFVRHYSGNRLPMCFGAICFEHIWFPVTSGADYNSGRMDAGVQNPKYKEDPGGGGSGTR